MGAIGGGVIAGGFAANLGMYIFAIHIILRCVSLISVGNDQLSQYTGAYPSY